MRTVIQRVKGASVSVNGIITGAINSGMLLLLGIEESDDIDDIEWLCSKVYNMRIFNDKDGKMNLNINDAGGEGFLVISQFTLFASTKKGNRPSFISSASPEKAEQMYELFKKRMKELTNMRIESGIFGADMKVSLINDGPVTIILDSKNRE